MPSKNIKESLHEAQKRIDRLDAELLLAFVLKTDRTHLAAHPETIVVQAQQKRFQELVARRAKHEPVAYLIGETRFYARPFFTDKRALVPRPETEDLVTRAIEQLRDETKTWLAWDVGTGTGIIPITLKIELPSLAVVATDISSKALALARKNARRHQTTLPFIHADLLDTRVKKILHSSPHQRLFITANLPYVPTKEKRTLMPDVRLYEPHLALFVPGDGAKLITRFLTQLHTYTKTDQRPWVGLFECDPSQTGIITRHAQKLFPKATAAVHKDLFGRKRFVEIRNDRGA